VSVNEICSNRQTFSLAIIFPILARKVCPITLGVERMSLAAVFRPNTLISDG
jgi:hypothetical protein